MRGQVTVISRKRVAMASSALISHGIGYEKIAAMLEVSTITVRRACAKVEKERELTDSPRL